MTRRPRRSPLVASLLATLLVVGLATPAAVQAGAELSTTAVVASDPSPTYGELVTFTAAVTGGAGTPTGTVQFQVDGVNAGDAVALDVLGIAPFETSSLSSGAHTIRAAYSGDATYDGSSGTVDVSVGKATLSVNAEPSSKTYGDPDPWLSWTYDGFVGSDNASNSEITGSAACGRSAGETVAGGPYTITCDPGTLAAPSYSFAAGTSALFAITARPLTVTATGVNRVYDGTTTATVTLSDNRVAGDVLATSYASATFADGNVGTGKTVSVSGISISGVDAGNYALANTTASTSAAITARPLTVTAIGVNKTYDGTTLATVTLSDDRVAGDKLTVHDASATFADENVGTGKTVTATGLFLTGTDADNYALASTTTTTTANITARPLTVTATGVNKVYDGTTTATVTLSDNRVAGDVLATSYASAAFADRNAGAGKTVSVSGIAISGPDAGNYTASTTTTTTATITLRPITVSADPKSKTYGTADPALSYQVTSGSLVAGDAFSGSLSRATDENVGTRAISQSSLTLGSNYALTYLGANLTITARPLTVTAVASSKVYDGTTSSTGIPTITSGTLVTGDSATWTETYDNKNVGTGKTLTPAGTVGDGNGGANYAVSFVTAAGTITALPITVMADPQSKAYGGSDPALSYALTSGSLAPGDVISGSLSRDPGETVGTYAITRGTLALGPNYALSYVGGNLSITTAPLVVTPDDKSKVYGQAFSAFTGTITGIQFGDDITATYASAGAVPGASVAGSPYDITATLLDPDGRLANYEVTLDVGRLTVTPVPTATSLATSFNPAPPGQLITLTAAVIRITTAQGTVRFQESVNGTTWTDLGGPVAVVARGPAFEATATDTLPLSEGSVFYRAVYASADTNYAGSTSPGLNQVAGKSDVTVVVAASRPTWETNVPLTFTATMTPVATGATVPITGDVRFTDGVTMLGTATPDASGVATLGPVTLALGSHTIAAAFAGDSSYEPGSGNATQAVVANVVSATGVGLSRSSVYPYRDGWRDTISIRGTRTEPLSVTIRIYRPTGSLLTTRRIGLGTGAYSSTWTGRSSSGSILPAGRYRIVQTLTDPSSNPDLAKSWTSYVTLSTKRMYWYTVTLAKNGNQPSVWSGAPSLLTSTRYRYGATLRTSSTPGWAAFGYSFTLPSATTYSSVAFYVQGGPWTPTPAKIGLHDWRLGTSWVAMYDRTRTRRDVGTSTSAWYGISGSPSVVVKSISGRKIVRAYVDSGPDVARFRYDLAKVKLVVRYGILR